MGSLANMLLGQAAPADDQAARDARIKELLAQVEANKMADPTLMPATGPAPAPQTMPAQGPAPAQPQAPPGGIMSAIMGLIERFSNSAPAKPSTQPTPAPPTPEELAARNRRIAGGQ